MSIPSSQTVQYFNARDGTPVAIASKTVASVVTSVAGGGETVVPVTAVSGTSTSFQLNADTLQLIGMSGTLPNSNLFVNYPHTMWERDAEGNRIPIQVTTAVSQPGGKGEGDALSQAAAVIKSEVTAPMKAAPVPTKSFICEICNKGFAKREHLTKHTRIHKDTKRYTCEYCQKQFRDRYELVRHQRRHTGDFPFRCNDCDKGFMRHERYMTHLRWHSGERPFQCTMCDKSFRDRSELNRHSRRHTGDLPYKCNTCMKGFLRRERYITHVRIHTGEKPFVCGVCSRGYRDKRELKKHQATHNHIDQNPESPTSVSSATMTPTTPNQITVMSPARTVSGLSPTKTITVSAAHHAPNNSMATITFSLPTEPVPKNQLGMAPEPVFSAPLNPAHIQLPPSVATALQNMNQKAKPTGLMLASTPVKQESVTQISGGHVLKQIQGVIEGGDGTQLALAGGSFPGLMAAGGGPQVFYYVMPSNVQPLITDGGRGSGEGATQFVALPADRKSVV